MVLYVPRYSDLGDLGLALVAGARVVQNATGKPPAVNIATQFDANFGTHSVTFQFKVRYLLSIVH